MATKVSRMKRTLAGILSCATLVSSLSLTSTAVSAEATTDTSAGQSEESKTDSSVSEITITGMEGKYSTYYNSHKDAAKPKKEITIYATDYKEGTIDGTSFVNNVSEMTAEQAAAIMPALEEITQKSGDGYNGIKAFLEEDTDLKTDHYSTIKWKSDKLTLTYEFNVEETGLYNLVSHFLIDRMKEVCVSICADISTVKSGKIITLKHGFHGGKIHISDTGKIGIQRLAWFAALIKVIARCACKCKDQKYKNNDETCFSFLFSGSCRL